MNRLAIYPGSFDPPTLGHLDMVERSARLFDQLIVAVGVNRSKTPLLSDDERVDALTRASGHLANVRIERFEGLLVDYARSMGAKTIVRGLRATADFEYEFQMAMVNRRLCDSVETVFLMTGWEHSYLSSSIVREVAMLGGDYRELVPAEVIPILEVAVSRLRKT